MRLRLGQAMIHFFAGSENKRWILIICGIFQLVKKIIAK